MSEYNLDWKDIFKLPEGTEVIGEDGVTVGSLFDNIVWWDSNEFCNTEQKFKIISE